MAVPQVILYSGESLMPQRPLLRWLGYAVMECLNNPVIPLFLRHINHQFFLLWTGHTPSGIQAKFCVGQIRMNKLPIVLLVDS